MPVELVIFDCDGVLIDSERLANMAEAECLRKAGFDVTFEEMIERYIGVSNAAVFADLEVRYGRAVPADYEQRASLEIAGAFERDLKEIPGIRDVLDSISCPVCIASGSSPERLRHSLSLVGLHDRFAPNIFSAHEVEHGKPAPDLFLHAAGRMGVAPANCLVIEDGSAGVRGAVAAGMPVVGFTGGSHCGDGHADMLRRVGADPVFGMMAQVGVYLAELKDMN
jgi:HAD superfamily hydrolase (TIGR01509 family)